jgi:REP element-mobilizing transposase RayT
MSHSYSNLLYHIVFSTKGRYPWLNSEISTRPYDYLGAAIRAEKGASIAINGCPDHIHILARFRQDAAVSDVLRALKANSSGWIHRTFPELHGFAWQRGYGAFSVSPSQVDKVKRYIGNQQMHHKRVSFREEFLALLDAHGIEYDERFSLD